jgi:hypothetical protein
MTAPEGPLGVRAYEELEAGDVDAIVRDLRKTVVRHVHKAIAATP